MTVVRKTSKIQSRLDLAVFVYILTLVKRGSQPPSCISNPKRGVYFIKFVLLLFFYKLTFGGGKEKVTTPINYLNSFLTLFSKFLVIYWKGAYKNQICVLSSFSSNYDLNNFIKFDLQIRSSWNLRTSLEHQYMWNKRTGCIITLPFLSPFWFPLTIPMLTLGSCCVTAWEFLFITYFF